MIIWLSMQREALFTFYRHSLLHVCTKKSLIFKLCNVPDFHIFTATHIKCQLHCKRRLCISLQSFLAFCNWICKIILSELICHLASHLRNDILAHGHLRPCGFFFSQSLKMQSKGSDFIAHSNYNLKDGHHLLAISSLNWCRVIIVEELDP